MRTLRMEFVRALIVGEIPLGVNNMKHVFFYVSLRSDSGASFKMTHPRLTASRTNST